MKTELNNVFTRLDTLLWSWKVIWALLLATMVVINVYQIFMTNNLWMNIIVMFCSVSSMAIFLYMKWKLLPSLQEFDGFGITIHSLITFILIIIGVLPLELLLISTMNLDLICSLGLHTVVELCDIGGAMLAIAVFLLVSMIYWMLLIEIRKEAILFVKCKKIKKEIYE